MVPHVDSQGNVIPWREPVILSPAYVRANTPLARQVYDAVRRSITQSNLQSGDLIPQIDQNLYSDITRESAQTKITEFYQTHYAPKEGEKRYQVTPMQRAYLQAGFTALETLALNAHDLPEYLTFLNDTYGALHEPQECVYGKNITPKTQLNYAITQQLSAPGNQTGLDLTLYIRFYPTSFTTQK